MKMDDQELIAAVEAMEASSLDAWSGNLSGDRAEALARYRGEPDGTEIEGRSQVVSRDLLDVVEWVTPSLARIFLSGDEVGKFAPIGPQDDDQADIETEVCNWYIMQRNDGFTQCMAAIRDALLLRNGYVLGWWETQTSKEEEQYIGLTQDEVALILQDKCVKVTEQKESVNVYGEPVFDIKLERQKEDEWVRIEAVPPDEIRVSRRHRMASLVDCDFVQWRHETTVGQLRADGFDVKDDAPESPDQPLEATYRNRFNETNFPNEQTRDPSRRRVIAKHNWIELDLEGTGKPQRWLISYIDGTNELLTEPKKADIVPVAAFTAIAYPHSHVGTSLHDLVADLSQIKQALTRQLLDNIYVGNNGRVVVDINRVNVDDLLVSRPGGVVRSDGPLGDAIVPLVSPDMTAGIMTALTYTDTVKDVRTGINRASVGLDPNAINKTATGQQMQQSAGRERVELIARTLAGGFVDLFRIVHRLVSQHSTKPIQLEINGKWMAIDPRSWKKRTQFSIAVGMGTGTPEVQMTKLQMIGQFMQQGAQLGLCGPQEFYNWGEEFLRAAGYRNTGEFLQEPKKDPQTGQAIQPPPQKPPEVQVEEIRQQGKGQELQMQAGLKQQEMQNGLMLQQSNDQRQAQLDAQKFEFDKYKMEKQFEFDTWKAKLDAEIELQKEQIKAAMNAQVERERMQTQASTDQQRMAHEANTQRTIAKASGVDVEGMDKLEPALQDKLAPMLQMMQEMIRHLAAPKSVVRDAQGRVVGVQTVQG